MDGDGEDNPMPPPAPSAEHEKAKPTRRGSARRASVRVEIKKDNFDDDREAVEALQALKLENHEADEGDDTNIVAPFLGKMSGF